MPKVALVCKNCGKTFERWPAYVRAEEERSGEKPKFCSRKCLGEARTAGAVKAKSHTGEFFVCEICKTKFYRKRSMILAGKTRFCSEKCRLRAHELKLVDRTGPRPKNRRGKTISCRFCGKEVYRKKSMIERNIAITCGDPKCVSAYGRSLWGLPQRDDKIVVLPRPRRKYRPNNFSPLQRKKWLADSCAMCGSTSNLMLDHITPACIGGKAERKNAQTLCGPCNNWKAEHIDRPLARKHSLSGG